jgi:phosphate:Na+ symporter
VAGERMKSILAKLTVNRFAGVGTGAVVTAVIQSSSVTTVLLVGFISAGLMSLPQSVGVIIGAKIGTTITGQIVAFKITKAALAMIAGGFAMLFLSKNEKIRSYGGMLMGLGLVFFGMHVMGEAMHPLAQLPALPRHDADDDQPASRGARLGCLYRDHPVLLGNHRYSHRHGFARFH